MRSIGDHIDLDNPAARQMSDADRRTRGQTIAREICQIDAVERGIVPLELGKKNTDANDVLKSRARPAERTL